MQGRLKVSFLVSRDEIWVRPEGEGDPFSFQCKNKAWHSLVLFSVLFFPTLDIFGKEVFICWAEENNMNDWKVQVLTHTWKENKYKDDICSGREANE